MSLLSLSFNVLNISLLSISPKELCTLREASVDCQYQQLTRATPPLLPPPLSWVYQKGQGYIHKGQHLPHQRGLRQAVRYHPAGPPFHQGFPTILCTPPPLSSPPLPGCEQIGGRYRPVVNLTLIRPPSLCQAGQNVYYVMYYFYTYSIPVFSKFMNTLPIRTLTVRYTLTQYLT